MLTGDNEIVTKKICNDVGIKFDKIMLGNELEMMDDNELKKNLKKLLFSQTKSYAKIQNCISTLGRGTYCAGDLWATE